jgi:hypothetical protein
MQPPFDQAGSKLGLTVVAIGGGCDLGCGDDDERRIPAESLVRAGVVHLLAEVAGPYRRRQVGRSVEPARNRGDLVRGDPVRDVDAAQRRGQCRPQQVRRHRLSWVHQALRTAPEDYLLVRISARERHPHRRPRQPGRTERVHVTSALRGCHEGELDRVIVDTAADRRAGGVDRRILVPQRDNGNRPFVHTVGADQFRDSCIGEAGVQMARLRREHHRMLGNGWCTRPAELDCAFESICETCTFFQTSIEFRPVLAAQHDNAAAKQQTGRQQLFSQLLNRIDQNQASRPA